MNNGVQLTPFQLTAAIACYNKKVYGPTVEKTMLAMYAIASTKYHLQQATIMAGMKPRLLSVSNAV